MIRYPNFFQISRPVHVIFKTDKLDYLRSPKTKVFFESFFFIGQGTLSTGKWNWNLLGFSSFISILGQCDARIGYSKSGYCVLYQYLWKKKVCLQKVKPYTLGHGTRQNIIMYINPNSFEQPFFGPCVCIMLWTGFFLFIVASFCRVFF